MIDMKIKITENIKREIQYTKAFYRNIKTKG